MIRIVLENIFFFLLPTLMYLVYVAFKTNDWPGLWAVLKNAPLAQLFVTGAVIMIATLILFSSSAGHKPGEAYTPSTFQDGKLQPGNSRGERK
jgi:heme/copper-type cytochrome/quinol oxidase subunit 3